MVNARRQQTCTFFALTFLKLVVGLVRCLLHRASALLLDDSPV
jgi:hypothetical protein